MIFPNPDNTMTEITNQNITPEFAKAYTEAISRTRDVTPDAENPFHKNVYATLGQHIAGTKAVFAQHGLAIVQFPVSDVNGVGVETIVLHASGGYISRKVTMPVGENVKGQDVGSIVSYLRRYAIASVANLATSDDDAEADRTAKAAPVATKGTGVFAKPAAPVAPVALPPKVVAAPVNSDLSAALNVPLHFGKNKGQTLGSLPENSLLWYVEKWEPKPYNGKISEQDVNLRGALDVIAASRKGPPPADTSDDVPF